MNTRAMRYWLAAAGLALLPAAGAAQVGAIGAAPASMSGTDEATAGTPLLMESAYMLGRGQWGVSALLGVTAGSLTLFDDEVDFTYQQALVGAFYAPSEKLMLGVLAAPYLAYEVSSSDVTLDDNGTGDVALYAKGQLWRSAQGSTQVAAFGSLALPVGKEGWGREGLALGAGLALSHRLERVSLHGAASIVLPTDDADGESALTLAGGAVYAASPKVGVSLELSATSSDGESVVEAAPGVRLRIAPNLFLGAAAIATVSSSLEQKPYDGAFVLGLNFVR